MSESPLLLSVIIVNWNDEHLLARCLQSLVGRIAVPHEIIVVDNGSEDGSVAMVRDHFPSVHLLALEQNLGFAVANNRALAIATGAYLLLLNPDTECRIGTLDALVTFMEGHPDAGIAGPTLYNPDGSLQPSTATLPSLFSELLTQTMLFRLLPTRGHRAARRNELRRTEMVSGAALMIRRACLEQVGPLDEQIFMFYEDTDLCRRALDAGWEIWFVPGPGIFHVGSAVSSRLARTRTLIESQRSTLYYFRKHGPPWAPALLHVITLLGTSFRALRAALLWLMGREREDQRARLRAYRRMVRWALTGRGLGEQGRT